MDGPPNPLRRLSGNRNAIRAHVIGRGALLALLAQDPAVVAAFGDCDLADTAGRLGALGEDLAHRAGLTSRGDLFQSDATVAVTAEYQALDAEYRHQAMVALPLLRQRLETLVYDTWQLEWPWLVYELHEHYQRLLNSLIIGDGWAGSFSTPPPTLPPPPPPEPGESLPTYLRRVRAVTKPAAPPRDRTGVRVNEARIARDVRIFYRAKLKQPPDLILPLSKAEGLTRYDIREAIKRAIRVLSEPTPRVTRPRT